MAIKVERTNEALWEACECEAVERMGKFFARAMQHAVVLYKERGGGYVGEKVAADNPLVQWSEDQKIIDDNSGFS